MLRARFIVLLLCGLIAASVFVVGMQFFKVPIPCSPEYTQQQIEATGCIAGATLWSAAWPMWVWAISYTIVLEVVVVFLMRTKTE